MDISTLLPWITGPLGALVVLALVALAFYRGRLHSNREFAKLETENASLRTENDRLRESLMTERRAVNETAQAGQVTNRLINAIADLAAERQHPYQLPAIRGHAAESSAEDLSP